MIIKSLLRWRVVGLVAACAAVAHAQTAPPIKPGLWQVHNERTVDGQKAPELGEHMKNMPPEMRKRMEANMKQHGVDLGDGAGNMKVCMTRESLDEGRWRQEDSRCKTEYLTRTSSVWKWRSSCTQPPSESEGEVTFASAERYTMKVKSTMTMKGQVRNSQMKLDAKWLGADCGDLKPLAPPRMAPSAPKR